MIFLYSHIVFYVLNGINRICQSVSQSVCLSMCHLNVVLYASTVRIFVCFSLQQQMLVLADCVIIQRQTFGKCASDRSHIAKSHLISILGGTPKSPDLLREPLHIHSIGF